MPRKLAAFCAVVLAAGLAACSGDRIVTRPADSGGPFTQWLRTDARDGKMYVKVLGNPFDGVSDAAFAQSAADAMEGRYIGPQVDFVTGAGEDSDPNIHIVLAFGAGDATSPQKLCKGDESTPLSPTAAQINVVGAFCANNLLRRHIYATAPTPGGVDDPAFGKLMGATVRGLFPAGADDDRDRDIPVP